MQRLYDPIVKDEVLYWFDMLHDNSMTNIVRITGIDRNKVRSILEDRYNNN